MARRTKNANAAAKAQNQQRKTAARNRIALNLMQHKYDTVSHMNNLRTEAAEMRARHQIEAVTLVQRHKTERASLAKKHEIERKAHTTKMNRGKKVRQDRMKTMAMFIKKLNMS